MKTTIGQLADLRYEIDSRGRLRIEIKAKARSRRRASPDRAEALMLAMGARRERILWLDQGLAEIHHREGRSTEAIADGLGATVEEVNSWIREQAELEAARYRPLELPCAGCHQPIDINAVRMRIMSLVYHEKCGRKARALNLRCFSGRAGRVVGDLFAS